MIERAGGVRGLATAKVVARAHPRGRVLIVRESAVRSAWRLASAHVGGIFAIALIFAFLSGHARAEQVTLATYNLENYVTVGRMVEGTYRQNYPKPEDEKTALRAVIAGLHADIIVFQEMGPRPFLNELQRDLTRANCAYPCAEIMEAADNERHVAILSRKPFRQVIKHSDLRFNYFGSTTAVKRGLLEVKFHVGQSELTVFAVHLKSRITDRSDDDQSTFRRTEEARAVRDCILSEYNPEQTHFILLGDCNDVPRSKPIAALLHRGKTKIFDLLPATDSRGETWTEWYRREDSYSRIDYALVSPALQPFILTGKATIADGPETLVASDHRPLIVTLDLP